MPEESDLHMLDKKAVSTLVLILLIVISAIIGGLISYMFTIAAFIEVPKGTALTIAGVYLDRENASSFKISVLNPSYSDTNATITRIAISVEARSQLYDISETDPTIENGISIPRGTLLNITCLKVQKDEINVPWGQIAGEFAGQTITIHVFSSDATAANMEATLPFVKLYVTETDFDSTFSFRTFNITIMNNVDSEINLTINGMVIYSNTLTENETSPTLPQPIAISESIQFTCNADWRGNTTFKIYTEEGYVFSKDLQLPDVLTAIQNVTFNEDYTDYFNVTVSNYEESANYVNVTKIAGTLENETTIEEDYPSVGMVPNSTETFTFNWTWKEYREKTISLTVYFLQDFETNPFTATTPSSIIVKVLNEKEVFSLKDRTQFNITLQNHPSSLEAINITEIVVKETGEVINGTKADPQLPHGPIAINQLVPFNCSISDWTEDAGENLTLIVHVIANQTLGNYTFEFVFNLVPAELNITDVTCIELGGTKYLDITLENMNYSLWNLTISKVKITLQNQSILSEQTFFKDQIIINANSTAVLLYAYDWITYPPNNIIITVITVEGVEASWQGTVPLP